MSLIDFILKQNKLSFSVANIYFYLVSFMFFSFVLFFSLYFYKFIFLNKNITLFLSFLYILSIFLVFSFFKKKNFILINFIFFFFIGLLILEFFIIYFFNLNEINKKKINYDDFKNKIYNEQYFPIIYPRYILQNNLANVIDETKIFPLSSLSNKKTILCNEDNFWSTYVSDKYGFNNNNEIWENKIEIAIFGDSFSHGNCVKLENQWVKKLQKKIPGTLNLSMGGNGPLMMLATLKEYYKHIKPDVVIWQYFDSHDTRIPLEKNNVFLNNYLTRKDFSQNLFYKQSEIDKFLFKIYEEKNSKIIEINKPKKKKNIKDKIKQIIFLKNFRSIFGLIRVDFKQAERDLSQVMFHANEHIGDDVKKYFLYIPHYSSIERKKTPLNILDKNIIFNIAKKNNFKIISADLMLKNYENFTSLYPYRGAHFNKNGYHIIYKVTEQCLEFFNQNLKKNLCEPMLITKIK